MLPIRSHPHPHPHTPTRRRSALVPQLCAATAALLLLLSLAVLHSRLSSSSSHDTHHFPISNSNSYSNSNSISNSNSNSTTDELVITTTPKTPITDPDNDRIDDDNLDNVLDEDATISSPQSPSSSALIWDHAIGGLRRPFRRLPSSPSSDHLSEPYQPPHPTVEVVFGSDDEPVDLELRVSISSIGTIEEALLLNKNTKKEPPLRAGWARWLEGKADYLRRDRMLRSNLELLNPGNHPLLQDPDGAGITSLTRGDRFIRKLLLNANLDDKSFAQILDPRRGLHSSEQTSKQER